MKKLSRWLSALTLAITVSSIHAVQAADIFEEMAEDERFRHVPAPTIRYVALPIRDRLDLLPTMLGDGFFGFAGPITASSTIDRLMVFANDLDAPNPLPAAGSVLSITEGGPTDVFSTSVRSVQEIQAALRNAQPLPTFTNVGSFPDAATLLTVGTIADIQAQLAASPQPYDIIALVSPPAGYTTGVTAMFVARNGIAAQTVYDSAASGALIQAGDDTLDPGDDLDAFYFYDYVVGVGIDSPFATAVRTGTVKIANGGTVQPTSRLFFDYGLYTDVGFHQSGQTVNRFVPGIERAFFDGLASFEIRLPFAATASTTFQGVAADDDVEFGDVTMFSKLLLHRSDTLAISAGLGLSLPTAGDIEITDGGATLVEIHNETVHLGPFAGFAFAPTDRCFAQGFVQTMFAANGNSVFANPGTGLTEVGALNDSSYFFSSLALGYWAIEPSKYERPLALLAELHHSTNVSDSDVVQSGNLVVGAPNNSVDFVNLTFGAAVQLGPATSASLGYIAPLTDEDTPGGGMQARLEYRP